MHIIAHRGASAYEPENTIAAFERAISMGADWVELDVRLSADGHLVVSHSDDLSDRTTGRGRISTSTLDQLRASDAGNGQRLPTFPEVLDYIHPRCGLYVELKAAGTPGAALRDLRAAGVQDGVVLGSFDAELVQQAGQAGFPTALLISETNVDLAAEAQSAGASLLHLCWENAAPEPHTLLSPEMLTKLQEQGLQVVLWHEEREPELRHLARMPVWGICTNMPDLLRRVLTQADS